MSASISRKRLAITTTAVVSLAIAVPVAAAGSAASASTSGSRGAAHFSFDGKKTVIVYMNRRASLPVKAAKRATAAAVQQAPVRQQLAHFGASNVHALTSVDAIIATVSASQAEALASNPSVKKVLPNGTIPGVAPITAEPTGTIGHSDSGSPNASSLNCGTDSNPELDPEALSAIHATPSDLGGMDGKGVGVAYMAEGIDTSNPDFLRNPAYVSSGSAAGTPVIDQQDFSGDGTSAPTDGGEAFIDAASVVAQGNVTYDISSYGPETPASPCDIKIVGAAPGASVTGLKVFSNNYATTDSDFLQAIDYAVSHHVKVLNESFGANDFPATDQDVVRDADDAAIKAGVTVVVSTGDSGITSTIGTPASDPKVISAGASTTYREYEQEGYGGTNVPEANGQWVDNNVSGLSSGGFSQLTGKTVNLLAPGDLNWGLCTPNTAMYFDCVDDNGNPTNLFVSGGTSEAAPLISAGAADVIQAYSSTHNGKDPSPALIKSILTSTAKDVGAPAEQGGAGLLNVKAAIAEAESLPGTTGTKTAGVLVKPSQINTEQQAGSTTSKSIKVTNNGPASETVNLSTRALTKTLASKSGSFCMQPAQATTSCPANTGTFLRETGAVQDYQAVNFTVPPASGSQPDRLVFHTAYKNTGQNSVLKVALLEPDGTYASYSEPQGQGDYADNEVANPPTGTWTAIFFTTKTDPANGVFGTKGKVLWNASTMSYASASKVSPSTLTIPSGSTKTAKLTLTAPKNAGDAAQSVVVATPDNTTTIPVTQRTVVPMTKSGGRFSGILTGGNGRDNISQNNSYAFDVAKGTSNIHTSIKLANDPGDTVFAGLVDPDDQVVSFTSNATTDNFGEPGQTKGLDLYTAKPIAGRWHVLIEFLDPVTGKELSEPYSGVIKTTTGVTSNLPKSAKTKLKHGKATTFNVHIANNGLAPQAYFADPRKTKAVTAPFPNLAETSTGKIPLPLAADFSTEPAFVVPPHTSQLTAKLKGSVPVNFSMYPGLGFDPDIAPGVKAPGVTGSVGTNSAKLTLKEPQITPGIWYLDPSEIGPYGADGAPAATATVSLTGKTQPFDPTVSSAEGDYWEAIQGLSSSFSPRYVPSGDSTVMHLTIKPTAKPGSVVHGVVYVDAATLFQVTTTSANEVMAIPYTYTVK